jgi:hypothetical protein
VCVCAKRIAISKTSKLVGCVCVGSAGSRGVERERERERESNSKLG